MPFTGVTLTFVGDGCPYAVVFALSSSCIALTLTSPTLSAMASASSRLTSRLSRNANTSWKNANTSSSSTPSTMAWST
ncbi:MAG: hypothetical protein BWY85_01345 [Firmicutes bacterium ADurb.Bin506]|nr:MAG: hypothetical protein BWY85_01345 [Firmicutes bacterium ADurb.Bin506]